MLYILKTKTFHRWQKKEGLTDNQLIKAINELSKSLVDADLGGGLYKKRVARSGEGKSSSYRTLIATNKNDKWFFIYGFAKNERDNITKQEETALKKLSADLLNLDNKQIKKALELNELNEVQNE